MKTNEELIRNLRADLVATNSALVALMTVLTPEQRAQTLKSFAELSVLKEATIERLPTEDAKETVRQVLVAEKRLYQALQSGHKLRSMKDSGAGQA